MLATSGLVFRLATALGIGLLIGAERERRKGEGPIRSPAGIRTFAIASLAGAVSVVLGGERLLAVTLLSVAALCAIGYLRTRSRDPGLTSEATLLLTVLLGALALRDPVLASGIGVIAAILLAARTRIHHFVRAVLSRDELTDALIFAAATLVVLPLTPDKYFGPFGAINLRIVWKIVILMMSISAGGYIAVRVLRPGVGLPLAGLASGFVSSAATIASMGARAVQEPGLSRAAVSAAVLSSVATVIQMAVLLAATSRSTLSALARALLAAGIAAAIYGLLFTIKTIRSERQASAQTGRAFNLKTALLFAATITAVLFASAALNAKLGEGGLIIAAAIAGFADTHSAAVSVASLVAAGKLSAAESVLPILAGLTTNTITKAVLAITGGGWRFALRVIPGLILMILGAWLGAAPSLAR